MMIITIETLEKGVKYAQSYVPLLLILNIFHTFPSVSIVDYEQVNLCCL